MSRPARILLNNATLLSFLLAALSTAAWVRSHLAPTSRNLRSSSVTEKSSSTTSFYFSATYQVDHAFLLSRGQIGYVRTQGGADVDAEGPVGLDVLVAVAHQALAPNSVDVHKYVNGLGFELHTARTGLLTPTRAYQRIIVPCWFPTACFAALPLIRARRAWNCHHRFPANACRSCGYDLRATPDRCPECGRVPASSNRRSDPVAHLQPRSGDKK